MLKVNKVIASLNLNVGVEFMINFVLKYDSVNELNHFF